MVEERSVPGWKHVRGNCLLLNELSQCAGDDSPTLTEPTANVEPISVAVAKHQSRILGFVGEAGRTGDILKLDLADTQLANCDVPGHSDWIDLAADQCTMLYSDEGPAIHRFDVCTSKALTDFVTGGGAFFALRILPDGTVLAASSASVKRFDSSGTPDRLLSHFWSGGIRTGTIYKFALMPVGPPVPSFSAQVANSGGTELAGLAVFGELIASQPTITPTAPAATAEPIVSTPETVTPALLIPMLVLLGLVLAGGALMVIRTRWRRSEIPRRPPPGGAPGA